MVDLSSFVRDIPDYPKAGILFRDITPLLADPVALKAAARALAEPFLNEQGRHRCRRGGSRFYFRRVTGNSAWCRVCADSKTGKTAL